MVCALLQVHVPARAAGAPDVMSILFLGDFVHDYESCPDDLRQLGRAFRERGDRLVLNLEGPLRGRAALADRPVILAQSEACGQVLREIGAVAVDLANNHMLDWGPDGLSRLIENLDGHGIVHFGAGGTLAEAAALKVVEEAGRRVGLLGFGWSVEGCVEAGPSRAGVAPMSAPLVLDLVKRSRPVVDFLAVSFHWGYEYELLPLPAHRELAWQTVDSGADLVIGHHPHVVQASETYRGKRIHYSLGNFYFGSRRQDFTTLNPVAARHSQVGMGVRLSFLPEIRQETVFFRYEAGETRPAEQSIDVEDISSIPMAEYNRSFDSRRTTRWKPSLYGGRLQGPLNRARLVGLAARTRASGWLKSAGLAPWLGRVLA